MSKTITLRLADEVYKKISGCASYDNRPISNFIETMTLRQIEQSLSADSIEMAEIKSNKFLLGKLKTAHKHVKRMRGKIVG